MIYVDSNVFIYAVGRAHPLRDDAQNFFIESREKSKRLVTSAEVLQELLHVYLPVGRMKTLDAALELATLGIDHIIPIDFDTVLFAHNLADSLPELTARDLLHLAVCKTNKIKELKSFDRNLIAAFNKA